MEGARELLDGGAKAAEADKEGFTPLHRKWTRKASLQFTGSGQGRLHSSSQVLDKEGYSSFQIVDKEGFSPLLR